MKIFVELKFKVIHCYLQQGVSTVNIWSLIRSFVTSGYSYRTSRFSHHLPRWISWNIAIFICINLRVDFHPHKLNSGLLIQMGKLSTVWMRAVVDFNKRILPSRAIHSEHKRKRKRSKKKQQTWKKIFAFASAFASMWIGLKSILSIEDLCLFCTLGLLRDKKKWKMEVSGHMKTNRFSFPVPARFVAVRAGSVCG